MRPWIVFLFSLFFIQTHSFGQVNHWETVVYEDDTWNYLVPSSPVSNSWNTLTFNGASWLSGPGGFGYGDGDDNTVIPATVSCFQRILFNITDINAIDQVIVNIDYDDAFVAYLNGVEIARDNISSAGQPPYNQGSDGLHEAVMYNGGYPLQVVLTPSFISSNLVAGNNVLALQTHNESAGSSDFSSRVWFSLGINNTSTDYGTVPGWFVPPFVFTDSNLPIVIINTAGGAAIPNEPKLDATMGIINNGAGNRNYVTDPFNEYQGDIGIEIRGSSSSGFPKKQWGLETRDPSGQNVDVSIFNMAYDNDWVLYAPYSDKSLIRNVLTYKMGWDTERFAPRTQLCEVVLNGEYQGVYVFTEKIKRKDGKVGINSVETTDNSGNEITGDYILKVDKFTAGGQLAWVSPFPPYAGATSTVKFQMHSPSMDSITPQQLNYIQTKVTDFETALDGPNFSDPVLGYAPYIDMPSFIDFFLVNEFGKNVDGYRISSYFHKRRDSEGGKIVAGPLWDFNLAFGNANYCAGGNTAGWELDFYLACGGDGFQNPFWWKKLTQDPNYTHDLNCRWQELRLGAWHTDTLMAYIDSMAVYLDESQQRNFNKWQILGNYVWPNNFVGNTYAEEINYLKTWITNRAAWLDANIFGSCTDLGVQSHSNNNLLVFPNPASNSVTFQFEHPINNGTIELYQASGQLIQKRQLAGTAAFSIDVSSLNSGVYYYKIVDETKRVETGKLNIQH